MPEFTDSSVLIDAAVAWGIKIAFALVIWHDAVPDFNLRNEWGIEMKGNIPNKCVFLLQTDGELKPLIHRSKWHFSLRIQQLLHIFFAAWKFALIAQDFGAGSVSVKGLDVIS